MWEIGMFGSEVRDWRSGGTMPKKIIDRSLGGISGWESVGALLYVV